MSKKRKALVALNVIVTAATVALLGYLWAGDFIIQEDNRRAVQQCSEEVLGGCPLLYDYASELEKENARLNLRVRECNALVPQAEPSTDTGR